MNSCENCECGHTGEYRSGRFCSLKCARSFSTKNKRSKINEKISSSLKGSGNNSVVNCCKYCKESFTVSWNKRKQVYCSRSCSSKDLGWKKAHSTISSNRWSEINKRSYKEGKNYVAGGTTKWYSYTTIDNKEIRVQGSYELRMCKILDYWKKEKRIIDWEYTNDRIEYLGSNGKLHNYLLDFKIFDYGKSVWYIEVKGFIQKEDNLKWKAAKEQNIKLKIFQKSELELFESEMAR